MKISQSTIDMVRNVSVLLADILKSEATPPPHWPITQRWQNALLNEVCAYTEENREEVRAYADSTQKSNAYFAVKRIITDKYRQPVVPPFLHISIELRRKESSGYVEVDWGESEAPNTFGCVLLISGVATGTSIILAEVPFTSEVPWKETYATAQLIAETLGEKHGVSVMKYLVDQLLSEYERGLL